MTVLLHFRQKIGLGVFICALGVMHFLETYLAANSLVELPFGLVAPGSAPFFVGKVMMILALYLEEDAAVVRQPIYGLLIGNFLIVALAFILRLHVSDQPGQVDFGFLDEMGALMIWGTLLLYVDALGIVLLYEKLRAWGLTRRFFRMFLAAAVMMTFDQAGFFALLHKLYGVGSSVFWGGLAVKIVCAALYAVLLGIYFRSKACFRLRRPQRDIRDIFEDLTFRERYESLLAFSGIDGLTGAFNRARFDSDLPILLEAMSKKNGNVCIAIIDIDFFKRINDEHGHLVGDEVLKAFATFFMSNREEGSKFYRYGGEEFVLVNTDCKRGEAHSLLDKLREELMLVVKAPDGKSVTFSAGVAEFGIDGDDVSALLETADMRLYTAKASGRNKVC